MSAARMRIFGRHTPDAEAGVPEGAALDQGDVSTLLGRLQHRRHRRTAAADDGNLQSVCPVIPLVYSTHLCPYRVGTSALSLLGRRAGQPCAMAEPGYRGNQGVERGAGVEVNLGAARGVGNFGRLHARDLLQRLLDVDCAGVAGHAIDFHICHENGSPVRSVSASRAQPFACGPRAATAQRRTGGDTRSHVDTVSMKARPT